MNTHQRIESALRKFLDAFNESRWNDFSNCIDESFKYFTDGCNIKNKEQFVLYLTNSGWDGKGYTLHDLEILTSDDGTFAVARYKIEFSGLVGGELSTVTAIETACCILNNNEWKMIHYHTSNKM